MQFNIFYNSECQSAMVQEKIEKTNYNSLHVQSQLYLDIIINFAFWEFTGKMVLFSNITQKTCK